MEEAKDHIADRRPLAGKANASVASVLQNPVRVRYPEMGNVEWEQHAEYGRCPRYCRRRSAVERHAAGANTRVHSCITTRQFGMLRVSNEASFCAESAKLCDCGTSKLACFWLWILNGKGAKNLISSGR